VLGVVAVPPPPEGCCAAITMLPVNTIVPGCFGASDVSRVSSTLE
jgi:hypothetical protein